MFMIGKVLLRASSLDIFDLNYFVSNESCGYLKSNPTIFPRKGCLVRVCAFIEHMAQEFKKTFFVKRLPEESILFFVSSKNQNDSISHVAGMTKGAVIAGEKNELEYYFPLFWAYLISLFFLPFLIYQYCKAGKYQKKTFRYLADIYMLTYGYYVVGFFWLRYSRPLCLVVANDHVMQTRGLIRIAQKMQIPTIYLQHASVTEKFPPLSFDYGLLEGFDALQKYRSKGESETRIYFVGMPKADAFADSVNRSSSVRRVGICCNMFDEEESVKELCRQLVEKFPDVAFTLRPHPADKRRFSLWKEITVEFGIFFSDSLSEKALEFLGKIDAMVAGESNIHLEAALLDVYPLYFVYPQKMLDWYGFRKNGVIEYFPDFDSLFEKIESLKKEKPSVRHRCKLYCHTVGTPYEWQSCVLAKNLIERIAYGSSSESSFAWVPCSDFGTRVFQPR